MRGGRSWTAERNGGGSRRAFWCIWLGRVEAAAGGRQQLRPAGLASHHPWCDTPPAAASTRPPTVSACASRGCRRKKSRSIPVPLRSAVVRESGRLWGDTDAATRFCFFPLSSTRLAHADSVSGPGRWVARGRVAPWRARREARRMQLLPSPARATCPAQSTKKPDHCATARGPAARPPHGRGRERRSRNPLLLFLLSSTRLAHADSVSGPGRWVARGRVAPWRARREARRMQPLPSPARATCPAQSCRNQNTVPPRGAAAARAEPRRARPYLTPCRSRN